MEQSSLAGKLPSLKMATCSDKDSNLQRIRFTDNKESIVWVGPENILFAKSADHYIKALVDIGGEKKWMIRHSTLKDLLGLITNSDFIRLNKFYIINKNHLSRIDKNSRILHLKDGFTISISHPVSSYVISILRY